MSDNVVSFPGPCLANRRRMLVADAAEAERIRLDRMADVTDPVLSRWAGALLNRALLRLDTGAHGRATEIRRFNDVPKARFWTRDPYADAERCDWVPCTLLTPEPTPKVPA